MPHAKTQCSTLVVAFVAATMIGSGCSTKVELFCDENTPCEDLERPFCDLNGEFPESEGIGRTCIADPFPDAGVPGEDAGLDAGVPACNSGQWTLETVDTQGNVGSFEMDIAVAGSVPHVAYYDASNSSLKVARRAGPDSWTSSGIEEGGFYARIAADSSGTLHLVHWSPSSNALRYGSGDVGSFAMETVSSGANYEVGLDVDSLSVPHVSYLDTDSFNQSPKYTRRLGGQWTSPEQANPGSQGGQTSLAVDATGVVHMSLIDYDGGGVQYLSRSAVGNWSGVETIESSVAVTTQTSLGLGLGDVFVAFHDDRTQDLVVARRGGGASWSTETVDSAGDVGKSPSLAIDGDGVVHVVYADETNLNLKYARRGPSDSTWAVETVDSNGSVGAVTSITVDGTGRVHVGYHDQGNQDVKYATRCP